MTSGIKLSNLYLRDGDNHWVSIKDAGIGDLVSGNMSADAATVKSTKLGDFFQTINNVITGGNESGTVQIPQLEYLRFEKDTTDGQNNIKLIYDDGSGDPVFITSIPDTDTPYTYTLSKSERADGDYAVLTRTEDGSSTSFLLPQGGSSGGGFDFTAEGAIGIIELGENNFIVIGDTGVFNGDSSGSGDSRNFYYGDDSTINISDSIVSMKSLGSVTNATANPVSLNLGSSFTAITDLVVDNYGRVTKITKTTFTLPSASTIVNNSVMNNRITALATQEIQKIVSVS